MKSLPRLFAIFALLIAGTIAPAADSAPPAAMAAKPKEEKPETELTKKMDKMSAAFRKLRRQAGDATKNAESLELVATLREYATAAAKLEPFKLTEIPEADRPKMLEGYQAKMKDLLATIDQLAAAFKAGQNEAAAKLVKDLGAFQKEGHKEYKSKSID